MGCARHVDVPFECVGNHSRLEILGWSLGNMRSEEKEIFEALEAWI